MHLFSFAHCAHVISTWGSPRIASIWPSFAGVKCKGALKYIHTSLKGALTLYICPLWIRKAIKGGLEPQPWHHGIISTWHHPELPKSDPASAVPRCKGALICLCTSLKGKITLHIRPTWMCEAIKGGLQPQPWHHGIISTSQPPRIAKIWPALAVLRCKGALICLCISLKGAKISIYVH